MPTGRQSRKGVLIFAAPLLCAKKEERAEKQEAKVPFVVEFLCVSASLRAKKEKAEKQETRSLSADRQARPDERLDFFAPSRLCEQKTKIKSEK